MNRSTIRQQQARQRNVLRAGVIFYLLAFFFFPVEVVQFILGALSPWLALALLYQAGQDSRVKANGMWDWFCVFVAVLICSMWFLFDGMGDYRGQSPLRFWIACIVPFAVLIAAWIVAVRRHPSRHSKRFWDRVFFVFAAAAGIYSFGIIQHIDNALTTEPDRQFRAIVIAKIDDTRTGWWEKRRNPAIRLSGWGSHAAGSLFPVDRNFYDQLYLLQLICVTTKHGPLSGERRKFAICAAKFMSAIEMAEEFS